MVKLLSTVEVGDILHVTRKTVRTWISMEVLEAVQVGNSWVVEEGAVRDFMSLEYKAERFARKYGWEEYKTEDVTWVEVVEDRTGEHISGLGKMDSIRGERWNTIVISHRRLEVRLCEI